MYAYSYVSPGFQCADEGAVLRCTEVQDFFFIMLPDNYGKIIRESNVFHRSARE